MKVILLGDTNTDNTSIVLIGKDCKVIISEGCSIGGGKLVCMGNSNFIHIVPNCMLSNKIKLWATDTHSIYCDDITIPINQSKSIILEEHVWVVKRAIILKGVKIGHNSLVVGNPSCIVRSGVTWSMDRILI